MIADYAQVGPLAWILPGTALAVWVALRWTRAAILPGLVVVLAAVWFSAFDAQPHVNEKFDATTLAWARVILLRTIGGLTILALAVPLSAALAGWAGWTRRTALAFYVFLPVGGGLLGSSLALQGILRRTLADPTLEPEMRIRAVTSVVHASSLLLVAGALLAVVGALRLAVPLWRRRGAEERFFAADPPRRTG